MTDGESVAKGWLGGRLLLRLQATLLGLLCFSVAAVPRLLPALLGLLAVLAAIHVFVTDPKRLLALLRTPIGLVLGIFIAYLFINAAWAIDPPASFAKAAGVLGLAVSVFLIAGSYSLCSVDDVRVLAKSALIGLVPGVAFLLIEVIFDEPITRFISNHIVLLFELNPKKVELEGGEVTKVSAFILNRNVTSLVLLLVPLLLFIWALAKGRRRRVGLAALIAATAICVLLSQSGTSVVAFFVGALVLGLATLSLRVTQALLVAAWTAGTLLAVPLAALPYNLGWQHWTWLPPESVAARFYIWKYLADEVHKRPIIGIGVRGTRALHFTIPADVGGGTVISPLRGRQVSHPHNIFLQAWLELGAIGAVLLLGVGLAGLWQIGRFPPMLRMSAYSLFAICGAVGVSGFDLWQTWLLAAVAFAWADMLLAARLLESVALSEAGVRG